MHVGFGVGDDDETDECRQECGKRKEMRMSDKTKQEMMESV